MHPDIVPSLDMVLLVMTLLIAARLVVVAFFFLDYRLLISAISGNVGGHEDN